jgi:hypothetical protein
MAHYRGQHKTTRTVPDPTPSLEIARFAYGEVLDATKHQDDKIGRILAAIAFLTGGALVFANAAALNTIYHVGNEHFRLTAIFLGVFLFCDLASVILYILTIMTPLTYPGTVSGSGTTASHIFFHVIARTPKREWRAAWRMDDEQLDAVVKEELIDEIYNLGTRAEQKNRRSRAASAFFLASILYLVPTVVLSLDTLSETRGQKTVSLDWALARRSLVAAPVAGIVLILVAWAWAQAHTTLDKNEDEDPTDPTSSETPQHEESPGQPACSKKRRSSSLGWLTVAYPVFVGTCIVSNGRRSVLASGIVVVGVAGLTVTLAVWRLFAATSSGEYPAKTLGPWIASAIGLTLTAAALVVIAIREPGLQLILGMLAATLVLADNIIRVPFPLVARAQPSRAASSAAER